MKIAGMGALQTGVHYVFNDFEGRPVGRDTWDLMTKNRDSKIAAAAAAAAAAKVNDGSQE